MELSPFHLCTAALSHESLALFCPPCLFSTINYKFSVKRAFESFLRYSEVNNLLEPRKCKGMSVGVLWGRGPSVFVYLYLCICICVFVYLCICVLVCLYFNTRTDGGGSLVGGRTHLGRPGQSRVNRPE